MGEHRLRSTMITAHICCGLHRSNSKGGRTIFMLQPSRPRARRGLNICRKSPRSMDRRAETMGEHRLRKDAPPQARAATKRDMTRVTPQKPAL